MITKTTDTYIPRINSIGHFPSTNYSVDIIELSKAITHNTAIIGILGIGKSMLAIEYIERILSAGIKVICLDLTNQYEQELNAYYDAAIEHERIKKIQQAGDIDRNIFKDNPEEGGSLPNLRKAIFEDLQAFLNKENPELLKIYNPAQLTGTKQLNDPRSYQVDGKWQRSASLWSITPVEVTQIITEIVLLICQEEMTDDARVCLVFEEAHSLVPEWNTAASEGDKAATNRTARAILQGRKYGLGCVLVAQRTANVTKTILNQCNTIFAMRTFDDTGKDFLSNYIGGDFASILPTLSERQAVFFGKASSCENPVLLRLNDQDEFRKVFRSKYPPPNLSDIYKSNAPAICLEKVLEAWHDIRYTIKPNNPGIEALLNSSKPIELRGNELYLGFQSETVRSLMDIKEKIQITQEAIKVVLGVDLSIKCVTINPQD